MDRRYELDNLRRSLAAVQRGQLAMRKEQAIEVLEELQALRGRHEALVGELRRLIERED